MGAVFAIYAFAPVPHYAPAPHVLFILLTVLLVWASTLLDAAVALLLTSAIYFYFGNQR